MRMDDPVPQFTHVVTELVKRFPTLAYLHFVGPRTEGHMDREPEEGEVGFAGFSQLFGACD